MAEKKEKAPKLVKMEHVDTGKKADVHPEEVENFKKGGFVEAK
jgi:hypothetical protein